MDRLTFRPRSTLSFITPMNSLWLRQLSPSMSKSLNTVSSTLSDRSWPVAIFTARLNWAEMRVGGNVIIYCIKCLEKTSQILTSREALPIPTGRLAPVTSFTEKAKSSRLLVNRQKALNSSNVILCKKKLVNLLQHYTEWRFHRVLAFVLTWPAGIFFLMFSQ